MVDIQAARAAEAAARTHCPALAHQTAIRPKARVISEKRTTIGTAPMLLLVLVREGVVALALVLAVTLSLLLLQQVVLDLAARLGVVVAGFAHAAGDALGARIQSSPQPRGVAQLVEHRSPKPGVAGSSPVAPAPFARRALQRCRAWRFAHGPARRLPHPDRTMQTHGGACLLSCQGFLAR